MTADIYIDVKDLNLLKTRLKKFGDTVNKYMTAMAQEAGNLVIKQQGLKKYPPSTEANQPGRFSLTNHRAMGYYQRGKGWNYPLFKDGEVRGYKNTGKSERYGTQFSVERYENGAKIINRASYAPYLTDEEKQSSKMAAIGWRKMIDVAKERLPQIKKIFDKWVQKALKESGL